MLQKIKKNDSGASTFIVLIIAITILVLLPLGHVTANVPNVFDWKSFGIFAALIPFISFIGGVVGVVVANKFENKSDSFKLVCTLTALAGIIGIFYLILFVAACWADSFPVANPEFFGIYGLCTWLMTLVPGGFASLFLKEG